MEFVEKVEDGCADVTLTSLQVGSAHLVEQKKWPAYNGGFVDRNNYLSASEMEKCLRRSWYAKMGDTGIADFVTNGYAERGNAVEAWIVERLSVLEKQGYALQYTGENQRTFYDVLTGISGTPDGLLSILNPNPEHSATLPEWAEDRHILLEFKSIDPRVNRRNLPKKAHVMQVQVNMHLVSLCLGIEVNEARLLYIDASDLHKQDEYIVKRHPDYWSLAVERAMLMHGAGKADDLHPEGLKNGDCDTCPFTAQCSAAIDTQAALIKAGSEVGFFGQGGLNNLNSPELSNKELDAVAEFLMLREQLSDLEYRADQAKNEARAIVMDHGNEVTVDGATIVIAISPGKETLDMKAVEAAGLDLSAYKKVGKPFTTMRVK